METPNLRDQASSTTTQKSRHRRKPKKPECGVGGDNELGFGCTEFEMPRGHPLGTIQQATRNIEGKEPALQGLAQEVAETVDLHGNPPGDHKIANKGS